MKAVSCIAVCCLAVLAFSATRVEAQMYDPNYTGPRNYYGHATFEPYITQPQQTQAQQVDNGLIFQAGRGLLNVGGYLWSYMPAPMRPNPPQYTPDAGAGDISVSFVPSR